MGSACWAPPGDALASIESFATERLVASRIGPADFAELSVLHHDSRVMATLGGVRTDAETRRFLREKCDHWEQYGFGMWMYRDRVTGVFVGRGGLQHIEVGGSEEVEVGYTVAAASQGHGLATEMVRAMVAVGFEQLGLTNLVAFTLPNNIASRRVMEKAGFGFERDIDHVGNPNVLYRLRR
jgi:RimJ/RimL family protein N-acetyltransferase